MGLDLAHQNQTLHTQVQDLQQDHKDLQQRISLIERDRRWMQQQSLRVDQVKAALHELQTRSERGGARWASEQKVDTLEGSVERLREDMEMLVRQIEDLGVSRGAKGELGVLARRVGALEDVAEHLGFRVSEVSEERELGENRLRAAVADTGRHMGEVRNEMQALGAAHEDTVMQTEAIAQRQGDIEQSLRSIIVEYNSMLNEHEQAIRILGDSQAVIESQLPSNYNTATGTLRNRLRGPSRADFAISSVGRRGGESLGDIFATDTGPPPMQHHQHHQLQHQQLQHQQQQRKVSVAMGFPPSPPLTMSPDHHPPSVVVGLTLGGGVVGTIGGGGGRKAASVIGTSTDRHRSRVRPRTSSFSKLVLPVSPTRLSPGGFGNIISASAHVGLGWGNYWQARRHRLQFDIQKRLGLPASPAVTAAMNGTRTMSGAGTIDLDIED
ncbi:hypothetical protein LPJ66_005773 [Kickxella alabastrina]|uniref:Uncharacterized protein n=1 Tax=Kickxella alabastrina TaxID=61397 RepID=A0ACC1IDS4_9FUNG|nr:hypothetical protein LPJ66_005773 [Kickxella alabastrina]